MAEDVKPETTAVQQGADGAAGTPQTGALPAAAAAAAPTPAEVWPQDWRERIAKDDTATLSRLKRYNDPSAALSALSQLQERINKGELRSALPKNATPEQMKAWREENGIPDDPKGYDLSLPDGRKVDLEERPDIASFLEHAQKAGLTQSSVKAALEWNEAYREEEAAARNDADAQLARTAVDELRKEWGDGYYANMNRVHALLDTAPDGVKELVLSGRMADGTPVGSHPAFLKWVAQTHAQLDPSGSIITESGASTVVDVQKRIDGIEKTMRENRAAYNKDEKMQAELRNLYEARASLQRRSA